MYAAYLYILRSLAVRPPTGASPPHSGSNRAVKCRSAGACSVKR